jgi:hypothetical protein
VSESSITQWHIIRKLTEFLSLPSHHRNKLKPPQLNQKTTVTDSNHHNRINHHHKFLKFIPVLYQNSSSNEQNHFKVPENRNKMCSIQQKWFEFSEGSQWFSVKIIIIEPSPSQFKQAFVNCKNEPLAITKDSVKERRREFVFEVNQWRRRRWGTDLFSVSVQELTRSIKNTSKIQGFLKNFVRISKSTQVSTQFLLV